MRGTCLRNPVNVGLRYELDNTFFQSRHSVTLGCDQTSKQIYVLNNSFLFAPLSCEQEASWHGHEGLPPLIAW